MNTLSIILIISVVGTLNIVCFFVGAKVGQKVSKGEPIETPSLDPFKAIRESREKKEAEKEEKRLSVIVGNAERYDGTDIGQEDVPER